MAALVMAMAVGAVLEVVMPAAVAAVAATMVAAAEV
jgi:hypothetical protein